MTIRNHQLVQDMKSRRLDVVEVPLHAPGPSQVQVKTIFSAISAGTERNTVEAGSASISKMAVKRPDLVKQTLKSVRDNGLISTADIVRGKLSSYIPLGYSNTGVVTSVGEGITDIAVGDRVGCGGAGFATHSSFSVVPRNLLAKVPENVSDECAAITTISAIAMQGFRESGAVLGDRVGIVGLGLVGLLSTQVAVSAGCRVTAFDLSAARQNQAMLMGAESASGSLAELPNPEHEFDVMIICAHSGSKSLLNDYAVGLRGRGQMVLVGNCPIELERSLFYERELRFSVSKSYGPGRQDADFEGFGVKYPPAHVRWTQTQNLEHALHMMSKGALSTEHFDTVLWGLAEAESAYTALSDGQSGAVQLALLHYQAYGPSGSVQAQKDDASLMPANESSASLIESQPGSQSRQKLRTVGMVGLGSHARARLARPIKKSGLELTAIANSTGVSSESHARNAGTPVRSMTPSELITSKSVDVVFIATRHDSHADLVSQAIRAAKPVFVEKPLAINSSDLKILGDLLSERPRVHVNLNRRYSSYAAATKKQIENFGAAALNEIYYEVNAPLISNDHWTRHAKIGGGPLIGEGCHFVDFCNYIYGQEPTKIQGGYMSRSNRFADAVSSDYTITLRYASGGRATINVCSTASCAPKEIIRMRGRSFTLEIDDFKKLTLHAKKSKTLLKSRQDKGVENSVEHFIAALNGNYDWDSSLRYQLSLARSLIEISES